MDQQLFQIEINIQGLYLHEAKQVSSPSANFSQLPWYDGKQNTDVNFNHPFISKNCLRQPFQTPETMLEKGVHLHFIVPQYLGRKVPEKLELGNSGQMPAAPNRWLISKSNNNTIVDQWYLESDYIQSEEYIPLNYASTIPYPEGKPYRYIGRCSKLSNNNAILPTSNNTSNYFKTQNNGKPLTILGHGELNFSSFYPNCNTVFGFYDPEGTLDPSITYAIIGWHDSTDDDLLYQTVTKWLAPNDSNSSLTNDILTKKIKAAFGLELNNNNNNTTTAPISQAVPTIFCGKFVADKKNTALDSSKTKVAIGQTGTEALSSFLANNLSQKINKNSEEAKGTIEDQLESVLMFSQLDENDIDVGAKFHEARHGKGFRPSNGETKWTVKIQAQEKLPTDNTSRALPPLPNGIGSYLNALNKAQQTFHRALQEKTTLQRQLYIDWIKYMQARYPSEVAPYQYPDADHIQYFIKNYCIPPIQEKIRLTGSLDYDQNTSKPNATSNNPIDLAHQVQAKWEALDEFIQSENVKRTSLKEPLLSIDSTVGPRFWEPKSPTVLISGLPEDVATVNKDVSILSNALSGTSINKSLSGILQLLKGENTQKLSNQTWSPFLLDWEFNLNPVQLKQSGEMTATSLTTSFNLDATGPEFMTSNVTYSDENAVFSGTVLLSTHTRNTKESAIERFFKSFISREQITYVAGKSLNDFLTATSWREASACFKNNNFITPSANIATVPNAYYSLWSAHQELKGQQFLSQTLDGFYEACIQLDKVPQFPIKEPIGFASDKDFTNLIKTIVGNQREISVETAFQFNLISCGMITLQRLTLIDNFGISTPINTTGHIPFSNTLNINKGNELPYLKPRLAQATRLNFNWLNADTSSNASEVPSNDDPASSPICGWLMNNYLDNNIAIYDAKGRALGYIDHLAKWNAVPWNTGISTIDGDIQNTHLYNVAQKIMSSASFMEDFMIATQNAQHNIAPQRALLHDIKSSLVGKPIAVVRAAIGLELKGLPAIDQSWSALLQDLHNCHKQNGWNYENRYNQKWTSVTFPCRLGEHMQFNDGLIGYWTENNAGFLADDFIAPQTTTNTLKNGQIIALQTTTNTLKTGQIDEYKEGAFQNQSLVINANPLKMTMLMDPHGLLHATTGILPTKAISIPEKHYLPALKKLKVWFASSPIIQAIGLGNKTQINLPKINQAKWQWWDPYKGICTIENYETNTQVSSEIKEGWIILETNLNN